MIVESLQYVGAARSIVIDESNVVRAGNGTLEGAKRLGLKLQVVDADGSTLIAVRRRGLTDRQKLELAFYDNRSAELAACSFDIRSQIIWRKPRFVLSRGHYHWQHEDAWYAVRRGRSARWAGSRKESSVWLADLVHRCPSCGVVSADAGLDVDTTVWDIEHADDTGKTTHGTQKPVECMARPMRNHQVDDVYEPFNGSGSTLMAAELLGRRCYAIEIEPSYVQQTIDRWEAFTGKKARGAGHVPHDRRVTSGRRRARPQRR